MAVLTLFNIKQNDREPLIDATLKRPDGTVKDLTGHTVKFLMRSAKTAVVKVDAAASVVSPTAGTVRYSWGASDTDTPGKFFGEFETTETATGKKTTFPNDSYLRIEITDDVG